MMKALRWLVVLALCALATSCGKSEWKPLQASDAGFRVLLRGDPHYTKQEFETPAGAMSAHLYSSDRPLSYYAVGYSDYPLGLVLGENPEKVFAGVRDTWLRRLGGRKVAADRPLLLAGRYPGLEFSAEGNAKGEDAFVQARLYLVDQRLYQLIAMGLKNRVPQGEINRFLNSFELVPIATVGSMRISPEGK